MTSNVTLSLVGKQLRLPAFQGRAGGGRSAARAALRPRTPLPSFLWRTPREEFARCQASQLGEFRWDHTSPHPILSLQPAL